MEDADIAFLDEEEVKEPTVQPGELQPPAEVQREELLQGLTSSFIQERMAQMMSRTKTYRVQFEQSVVTTQPEADRRERGHGIFIDMIEPSSEEEDDDDEMEADEEEEEEENEKPVDGSGTSSSSISGGTEVVLLVGEDFVCEEPMPKAEGPVSVATLPRAKKRQELRELRASQPSEDEIFVQQVEEDGGSLDPALLSDSSSVELTYGTIIQRVCCWWFSICCCRRN